MSFGVRYKRLRMRIPFWCLWWKLDEYNDEYAKATLLYPWKIERRFVDGNGDLDRAYVRSHGRPRSGRRKSKGFRSPHLTPGCSSTIEHPLHA